MNKTVGNGIVVKDGRWVMQCGSTDQPVRLFDAQNREIEPISAEAQTAENGHQAAAGGKGKDNE